MNKNYRSNLVQKWWWLVFLAVCLPAFLWVGVPNIKAQSGNLPILFSSSRLDGVNHVFGMNTDGSNQTQIGISDSQGTFASYSPNGQKIVYARFDNDAASPVGFRRQIYMMNPNGTNQINISNDLMHHQTQPSWSPDGTKIAFLRFDLDHGFGGDIWLMNADGSNQHSVFNSPGTLGAYQPIFSPDGRIAFTSDASGHYEIYVINADGSNLRQLTNSSDAESAASDWSPDGTKIVYARDRLGNGSNGSRGNSDIYVMNADGTNQTRVTKHGNPDFNPIFSPDGTQIAFTRGFPNGDVYKMNADGSNVIRLSNAPGRNFPTDWR